MVRRIEGVKRVSYLNGGSKVTSKVSASPRRNRRHLLIAINSEKETTPLIEWLAVFRSHCLAVPGMLHRRHDPMVVCQTKAFYLGRRAWFSF